MMVNYFQYILHQNVESLLFKMLMAQIVKPVKGDYYHQMTSIMGEIGISKTVHEIKNMTKSAFKTFVKQQSREAAFAYLKQKQANGSKGTEIKYSSLQMADYLLPQANLSIEEQREIFSIRCRTNDMKANIGILEYCECKEVLNNSHIFKCKNLNTGEKIYDINYIMNGYTKEMKEHLKVWRENMKRRSHTLDQVILL